MVMVGVVEDGIILYGVLFRGKGVIAFAGAIKFEDEVLASFSDVLDSCCFSCVDGISLVSIPPVLRNCYGQSH